MDVKGVPYPSLMILVVTQARVHLVPAWLHIKRVPQQLRRGRCTVYALSK